MTDTKVFDKTVYDGFKNGVEIVKKIIKPFEPYDIDKVFEIISMCAIDSEYVDKFKSIKTHTEEKTHLFKIKQKEEQRKLFVDNFATSIPTKEAVTTIKEFVGNSWILEINMHRGLWAALLRGIKVDKVDVLTLGNETEEDKNKRFLKPLEWIVDESDKDAVIPKPSQIYDQVIEHYNVLLIVDPKEGNETKFAYECLCKFKGGKVIYIGEEEDSDIFKHLEEKFKFSKFEEIPNWFDDHSYVQCYDRIVF